MSVKVLIRSTRNWFIGEDRTFPFEITNEDGSVASISGWDLKWELRKNLEDVTAAITKVTPTQIEITDAVNGKGEINIEDTDTDGLVSGVYHHALKRTNAGEERVLFHGEAFLGAAAVR
jgi:hypothetical protein